MISVIVPLRNSPHTASRTLEQLALQCRSLSAEVIAAIASDDSDFPNVPEGVRLIVVPAPAGVPQLRRDAVIACRGEWIVITEDHCQFPDCWLATLVAYCQSHSHTVTGGPVNNARHSLAGWAQYFTRYSAFFLQAFKFRERASGKQRVLSQISDLPSPGIHSRRFLGGGVQR